LGPEPPRPPGAFFMYSMKYRAKILAGLPEKHSRKEASQALSAKWKSVSDEKKQEWNARNKQIKEVHDAWVKAGGIPAESKAKQIKARKDAKAKKKQGSGIDLTPADTVAIVAEVNRRIDDGRIVGEHVEAAAEQTQSAPTPADGNAAKRKQPRRAPDESAGKKRKVAKEVLETEGPPPAAAASQEKPPTTSSFSTKKLLKDFGHKVPEDQKCGLKLWLEKRLEKIVSECEPVSSDKQVWKAAKKKWNELADDKKQKWMDIAA